MAFLSSQQLAALGFAQLGAGVLISERASIYGASRIELGDDVRIDDFCVLSAGTGGIGIQHNVHIACHCSLIGAARIEMHAFSGLSSHVAIYSSSDDYSGRALTNPTVAAKFRNVSSAPVTLGRHVIIGSGSVVLPGVTIGEGAAVGALSMVSRSLQPFTINVGVPAKRVAARSQELLQREQEWAQG